MCHAAGQSTGRVSQKLKNGEATFSSGRLDILANGRASVINSSSVPIPDNECDTRCIDVTAALSGGCYGKCAWASPEVVACDAAKDRLFLGIYTGLSQNKTIVLVQANLRDKSFRHIAARSAAGLTNGAVSPSGKFLAYSRISRYIDVQVPLRARARGYKFCPENRLFLRTFATTSKSGSLPFS